MFGHAASTSEANQKNKNLNILRHLPDQTNPIFVGFPEPKYTTRAHTNTSVSDSSDGVQTFIIRSRCDNLYKSDESK